MALWNLWAGGDPPNPNCLDHAAARGSIAAAWLKRQCWDVCEAGKRSSYALRRKFVGAKPKSQSSSSKSEEVGPRGSA